MKKILLSLIADVFWCFVVGQLLAFAGLCERIGMSGLQAAAVLLALSWFVRFFFNTTWSNA